MEKDINSTDFLEQLHELQHKLNFLRTQQFGDAKAVEDVHDVIDNLKYKVCQLSILNFVLRFLGIRKSP